MRVAKKITESAVSEIRVVLNSWRLRAQKKNGGDAKCAQLSKLLGPISVGKEHSE
jgi:hypothetical protein